MCTLCIHSISLASLTACLPVRLPEIALALWLHGTGWLDGWLAGLFVLPCILSHSCTDEERAREQAGHTRIPSHFKMKIKTCFFFNHNRKKIQHFKKDTKRSLYYWIESMRCVYECVWTSNASMHRSQCAHAFSPISTSFSSAQFGKHGFDFWLLFLVYLLFFFDAELNLLTFHTAICYHCWMLVFCSLERNKKREFFLWIFWVCIWDWISIHQGILIYARLDLFERCKCTKVLHADLRLVCTPVAPEMEVWTRSFFPSFQSYLIF